MILLGIGVLLFFIGAPICLILLVIAAIKKNSLKNPLVTLLVVLVLSTLLIGIGGAIGENTNENSSQRVEKSTDESVVANEEDKQENQEKQEKEFTYEKMTVKYLRHEISENAAGDDVLIVYYEFTNNSKDNAAFDYSFSDKCFQNGVELEGSIFHANDETKNSDKEIQPGTTLEVASAFMLGDSMDTVTLEIEPWVSFTDKKLMTLELELQ